MTATITYTDGRTLPTSNQLRDSALSAQLAGSACQLMVWRLGARGQEQFG